MGLSGMTMTMTTSDPHDQDQRDRLSRDADVYIARQLANEALRKAVYDTPHPRKVDVTALVIVGVMGVAAVALVVWLVTR